MKTYCSIDFLVEVSFLELESSWIVLDLGVGVVLDVHGSFLALCLTNTGISVGLNKVLRQLQPGYQTADYWTHLKSDAKTVVNLAVLYLSRRKISSKGNLNYSYTNHAHVRTSKQFKIIRCVKVAQMYQIWYDIVCEDSVHLCVK